MKKDFITATPDSGGSGSTTVTVAASANQTESTRSTSLSVAGGGMTRTVGASQASVQYTITYKSSGSFENTYFAFNSNSTPTGTPMQYRAMLGGEEEFRETWSPDPGYSVNNVSKGGATTNLKAGDRVWIRKMTGIGTSWSGSTTQSFVLEANNQTVNLN